jgi:cation:H+ antiporter
MLFPILAIIFGLAALVWGADRFVLGAATTAKFFRVPPLLIGMLIVGFGTSAPELLVSGIAAYQGNSGLALGNAYGSNITNIALILGLTALISPIAVQSKVLRIELPILTLVTLGAVWQLMDGQVSRMDAVVLLIVFAILVGWSIWTSARGSKDAFGEEIEAELTTHAMPVRSAVVWLIVGLAILIVSSRALVWGAVEIATSLGVSDLIIGLTILAVGTSLPELASSLIAAKRGEHDIALGNVLGSNLFNTLAVVGIAGMIRSVDCDRNLLVRDIPVMVGLTVVLFVFGYGFRGQGRINRLEGLILLLSFVIYSSYLVWSELKVLPATSAISGWMIAV